MFKDKLNGKILVIFSDPGGAKPCLSISDIIDDENLCVISDRNYPFYNHFKSKVNIIQSEAKIEDFINNFNPNIIFTGTSYTSTIEKTAIKIAKEKGIISISFVDHWTSISDRFRSNDGKLNLPNEVWVLDERAKKIGIEEGIDAERIIISGNPYHNWLSTWKSDINRETFFMNLELNSKKKYILFAPDPLSNIDGLHKYGFDEFTTSKLIIKCVEKATPEFKNSYHFLIKMHPNQFSQKLTKIFSDLSNFTILPLDIDANQCIFYSDVVIGFFSSLLIEADIMNKVIFRFLEEELNEDPFLGLNLGTITNSKNLIKDILKQA